MFVIADLGGFDLKVMQQFSGVASIFGGDEVCGLQDFDSPKCHIFQVADRGSDDVKYSCIRICLHFKILEFLTADSARAGRPCHIFKNRCSR